MRQLLHSKPIPMITGLRSHFVKRCAERGYTLDAVRPCIVSEDGDKITVDETHPAYPREPKLGFTPDPVEPQPTQGPGTELKKLLKLAGITAKPNCSCNARARTMDANGCDWCEANIDQIVGWLREEAGKRGLPFVDMAGRVLVRRAIRNARKEQARAQAAKEGTDKGGGSSV